jgi:hypothetical protein
LANLARFAANLEDRSTRRLSMAQNLSVVQMLEELQAQVAYHRERAKHHAEQETAHREKRELHAEELQRAEERCTALQVAVDSASEQMARHRAATASAGPSQEPLPAGRRAPVVKLVERVIESYRPEAAFGPAEVARDVNLHYGAHLSKRVDARVISVPLRRMAAAGRLHNVQKGTPHHEALYSRRV